MKKVLCLVLAAICLVSMVACSDNGAQQPAATSAPAANAPATGNNQPADNTQPSDSSATVPSTGNYTYKTSADNRVYTEGEFDKSLIQYPVLITSFGQSADVSMLDALFKKLDNKVDYTFDALASADVIANYKTVIIAGGMSSKGLGAAGISEETEFARANAIIEEINKNNTLVIFAHLGGSSRRGAKSDEFSDMVMNVASYLLVVEEGNEQDSKFSNFAINNNLPYSLVFTIADCLKPLNTLFN